MEGIINAVSENRILTIGVILAVLLIGYCIVKSVVKIGIILLIVIVVIGGYLYFKDPRNHPESLRDDFNKAKTGASEAMKKGQNAYQKSREWVQKGTDSYQKTGKMVKSVEEILDKQIEKGTEAIEKGKEKASDIIHILKKDSDDKKAPEKPSNGAN